MHELGWKVGTWTVGTCSWAGRWGLGAWPNLMVAGSHKKRVGQLEGTAMRELGWKVGGHLAPGAM